MALNVGALQSELLNIFSSTHPAHALAAQKVATAISNYWALGTHPLGGTVISSGAIPVITAALTLAWAPHQTAAATAAKDTADAIEKGLLVLIITGAPYGVGGVASATGAAGISALTDAFTNTPIAATFAQKFATGVEVITKTNIVFGTGTPPAVPPPTGSFF